MTDRGANVREPLFTLDVSAAVSYDPPLFTHTFDIYHLYVGPDNVLGPIGIAGEGGTGPTPPPTTGQIWPRGR